MKSSPRVLTIKRVCGEMSKYKEQQFFLVEGLSSIGERDK